VGGGCGVSRVNEQYLNGLLVKHEKLRTRIGDFFVLRLIVLCPFRKLYTSASRTNYTQVVSWEKKPEQKKSPYLLYRNLFEEHLTEDDSSLTAFVTGKIYSAHVAGMELESSLRPHALVA